MTLDARSAALVAALPGSGPAVVARAPGRVNLIGEHTDYNGLPVLPIAIDRNVRVAARATPGGGVTVENVDPAFPAARHAFAPAIPPSPPGDWVNYAKAAAQAVAGLLERRGRPAPAGAALRVDGDVPAAAGLSSSSALVVGCGLAHLALAGLDVPRAELAELFADAERYVGTLSGGMDQAASLLARAGHALRIDFLPLRTRPVPIPSHARFVVARSRERAEKSGGARGHYNQRVVECALAAAVLARRTGIPAERLGDFPDRAALLADLAGLLPAAATRAELGPLTGLAPAALDGLLGRGALADPTRFVLRTRVRHVLGEAARVDGAEAALAGDDLERLGALMDASHASCAGDYAVSTPGLDALVALARRHGALGARLTGAGFGGSIVALVRRDGADGLVRALEPASAGAPLVVEASDGASVDRVS